MSPMHHILLIEDSHSDIRLLREAFKESRIESELSVVFNGEQALDFLYQRSAFTEAKRPDLILLDLNLPKQNGLEILALVKGDVKLKAIPIIVLTASDAQDDILRSYALNANCYITKPMEMDQFLQIVQEIQTFWFKTAKLPSH